MSKQEIQPIAEVGTFRFKGKPYTSGGAWLLERRDTGRYDGMLYAYPKESKVGTWDGKQKYSATFLRIWNTANIMAVDGRPIRNQHIRFKIGNRSFSGIWHNMDWSDCVHVVEVKSD